MSFQGITVLPKGITAACVGWERWSIKYSLIWCFKLIQESEYFRAAVARLGTTGLRDSSIQSDS